MAVISHVHTTDTERGSDVTDIVTWETLTETDTCETWDVTGSKLRNASVQLTGTWGSATVVLQQSNDGTTWFTADDFEGTAVSATANAFFQLSLSARYLRPSTSGGTGSDVDIVLVMRG